jgi:Flp pilus assembly protein TadD
MALAHRSAEQAQPWRDEARTALELNPRIAEGYGLLADAYSTNPNWGCVRDRNATIAEESYRKALQIDPRSSAAYNNLAAHLTWIGRPKEALDVADEGLQVQPPSPVLHRARIRALVALRRAADADRSVELLRKRQSLSALERITLGAVDLQLGRLEAARQAFEEAATRRRCPSTTYWSPCRTWNREFLIKRPATCDERSTESQGARTSSRTRRRSPRFSSARKCRPFSGDMGSDTGRDARMPRQKTR